MCKSNFFNKIIFKHDIETKKIFFTICCDVIIGINYLKLSKEDQIYSQNNVETIKPMKEKIYAKVQIHGTYLIGENEKGMYLVDQHAAQELQNVLHALCRWNI